MKGLTRVIFIKEFKEIFTGPLFYGIAAVYLLISGWLFFHYLVKVQELTDFAFEQAVLRPLLGAVNFIFIFLVPILTMKSFAEEKKDGTLDLLFLSRAQDIHILAGKFLATLVALLVLISLLALYPLLLSFSGFQNWSVVASGLLALVLATSCYAMVGVFFSSISKSQLSSAIMSYAFLFFLMLFILSSHATSNFLLAQMFQYVSFLFHFEQMAMGFVHLYGLIYFISFFGIFSFMTLVSLKSRFW